MNLLAAVVATTLVVPAVPEVPRYEPDREPKTVDELYLVYRYLGLPLPPTDATLTRWVDSRYSIGASGAVVQTAEPQLGIVVRKRSGAEPAVVWNLGVERPEFAASRLRPVPVTVRALDGIDWNADDWLPFAAQAYHLGWYEVARAAFERGRKAPRYSQIGGPPVEADRGLSFPPSDEDRDPVLLTLRTAAWHRAYDAPQRPGTDRRPLRTTLGLIAAADPRFRPDPAPALLRSLDHTFRPARGQSGAVEGLIDGLTESPKGVHSLGDPSAPPDAFDRLVERGFDAVPALIAHLDDDRLTRAVTPRGINLGSWVAVSRVGDSCRAILDDLSGRSLRSDEDDDPPEAYRKRAVAWFGAARKIGEERWAVDHARPGGDAGFSRCALRVVRVKFPRRLPDLYRAALSAGQNYGTGEFAAEVAASALGRDAKLSLLRDGAASPVLDFRVSAVEALERVDPAEFRRTLRNTLDWLATIQLEDRAWDVLPDRLVPLVIRAADPECWAALANLCRTAPASFRTRHYGRLVTERSTRDPAAMRQPLKLLVAALPDRTVWSRGNEWFARPADGYSTLAVGDYAALALADYFDIDVPWDPTRSAAGWAAVREKVRTAAEAELSRQ